MYQQNDRVTLTYRNFDLRTDEFLGHVTEYATVTRVWSNGHDVTVRTDTGKVFVRNVASKELAKA